MSRLDRRERLLLLPAQTAGLGAAAGLSARDTDAAAWAVATDGSRHRGAGAIYHALDQLLPGPLAPLGRLYRLPGLRGLSDTAYRWVARNRGRLPGTPSCSLPSRLPPLEPAVVAELARRGAPAGRVDRP
jgi:predicted DCC family thiol-disulfide oxidoreductase YuxK